MFVPNGKNTFKVFEQKNAIQKDASLGHYYISSEKFEELRGFEVHPNDIIVSCAGTIGETYVLPNNIQRGIINQALMIIRLFDSNIQRFYLEYFDFVLKNNAVKEGKGTAIKNIPPFDILKSYPFPLPPIDEQNRIVKKLDTYFELIQSIDDSRLNLFTAISSVKSKILDLAMQGKLVPQDPADEPAADMLLRINPKAKIITDIPHSWKIPENWTFSELYGVSKITMGQSPSGESINNEYGIEFHQGKLHFGDTFLTVSPDKTDSPTKVIDGENILLCVRAPVGVVNRCNRKICIGRGLAAISPSEALDITFLFYMFKYLRPIFETKSTGSTFKAITGDVVKTVLIPIPPLNEQKRIITKIEQLYAVLDKIEASLRS